MKTFSHEVAPVKTLNAHRPWLPIQSDDPVLDLARLGDLEKLEQLQQRGGVPMNRASYGRGSSEWTVTPMLMAAMHGHDELVSFFQSMPVDIPRDTQAIFSLAADEGDVAVVQNLLKFSWVDVNGLGAENQSALYAAAKSGHLACVETLLHGGAKFEWGQEQKYRNLGWPSGIVFPEIHCTPLRAACLASKYEAVELFLKWAQSHELKHERSEAQGIYEDVVKSKNLDIFRLLVAKDVQYRQNDVKLAACSADFLRTLLERQSPAGRATLARGAIRQFLSTEPSKLNPYAARPAILNLLPFCASEDTTDTIDADTFSSVVRQGWGDVTLAMLHQGAELSSSVWKDLQQGVHRLPSSARHLLCASLMTSRHFPAVRDIPAMRKSFDSDNAFVVLWNDITRAAELCDQRTPHGIRALFKQAAPPTQDEMDLIEKINASKASLEEQARRDVKRLWFT